MASPGPDPSSPPELPKPEPSDSEEVARALKLAQTLWEEGQKREAVRTLQRGAAQAEEDGNDLRALALARSAADLSVGLPPSVPPPEEASEPIIVEIEVSSAPNSSEVPIVVSPEETSKLPVSPPPATPSSPGPAMGSTPPAALGIPRASVNAPKPANGVAGFAVPVTQREVRVSVKRSALDESLFVVRPLAPGARAPAGTREALLVFSDADPE